MKADEKSVVAIVERELGVSGLTEADFPRRLDVIDPSFDSLDRVELVMELEHELEIEISDADADGMQTLGDVIAIVRKLEAAR